MMLLAVLMLFGVALESHATFEGYKTVNGIDYYGFVDKNGNYVCRVKGRAEGNNSSTITLESTINGNKVTQIAIGAFYDDKDLVTFNATDALAEIRDKAFYGCVNLKEFKSASGLRKIGNNAFEGCKSLTSLALSSYLTEIGEAAFKNSGLASLTGSNYVLESVGMNAFEGCKFTYVPEVIYDNNTWSEGIFKNCVNLKSVIFPEGIKVVPGDAFADCTNLSSLMLAESITSIGESAFWNCPNLKSIRITSGITHLGGNAFSFDVTSVNFRTRTRTVSIGSPSVAAAGLSDYSVGSGIYSVCSSIFGHSVKSITFDNSITKIGDYWFCGMHPESITLPTNLQQIGDGCFWDAEISGTRTFKNVTIGKEAFARSYFNKIILNNCTIGDNAFADMKQVSGITLTNCSVGQGAFSGNRTLTNLSIDGGTLVGNPFEDCPNLIAVNYDGGDIYEEAFASSKNLQTVIIGSGVNRIHARAFNNCTKINSLTFSERSNKLTIDDHAFTGCHFTEPVVMRKNFSLKADAFLGCEFQDLEIEDMNSFADGYDGSGFTACTATGKVKVYDKEFTNFDKYAGASGVSPFKGSYFSEIEFPNINGLGAQTFVDMPRLTSVKATGIKELAGDFADNCPLLKNLNVEGDAYKCNGAWDNMYAQVYKKGSGNDYETLVFLCPAATSTNIWYTCRNIDLKNFKSNMLPVEIDARQITDHNVSVKTYVGNQAENVMCRIFRIATGARKYFKSVAEMENAPAIVQDYIQGDVNDDGQVSVADVMNVYDQLK